MKRLLFVLAMVAAACLFVRPVDAFYVYDDNVPVITPYFLKYDPNFPVEIKSTDSSGSVVCLSVGNAVSLGKPVPLKQFTDSSKKTKLSEMNYTLLSAKSIGEICITLTDLTTVYAFGNATTEWAYNESGAGTECTGTWDGTHTCAAAYDGSWSTWGTSVVGQGNPHLYVNYTIPGSDSDYTLDLPGTIWSIRYDPTVNITIFDNCTTAGNLLQFHAQVGLASGGWNNFYQCKNSSGEWTTFNPRVNHNSLFEEAVYFHFVHSASWYDTHLLTNCSEDETSGKTTALTFHYILESNQTAVNASLDITFDVLNAAAGLKNNYSFIFASNETASVCMYPSNASYQVDAQLQFDGTVYSPRSYYLTNATLTNVTQNINLYLLEDASSSLINLIVVNSMGSAIPNALVTIQKLIGSDWQTIAQQYTDQTGNVGVYLNINTQYRITVFASGYNTMTNVLTPSNPPYIFTMSTGGIGTYETAWSWITYTIKPYRGLYANSTETINLTITDQRSDLASFGLNLTYNGSVIFTQEETSSPSGGQIFASVNLANASAGQTVTATMWFQRTDYSTQTYTKTYYIFAQPGSGNTLAASFNALGAEFDPFEKAFISIIVTFILMVFMALAFPSISKEGVAYAGLGILAIFTYYGWFNLIWLIVLAFITLGLKVLGGRL